MRLGLPGLLLEEDGSIRRNDNIPTRRDGDVGLA
jgi:hypothetical protein